MTPPTKFEEPSKLRALIDVKKDHFSTKLNVMNSNSLVNVLKKEPYIIGHATFLNNGIKLGEVICYEQGARTMVLNSLKWTMQFHLVCIPNLCKWGIDSNASK